MPLHLLGRSLAQGKRERERASETFYKDAETRQASENRQPAGANAAFSFKSRQSNSTGLLLQKRALDCQRAQTSTPKQQPGGQPASTARQRQRRQFSTNRARLEQQQQQQPLRRKSAETKRARALHLGGTRAQRCGIGNTHSRRSTRTTLTHAPHAHPALAVCPSLDAQASL